MVIALLGGLQVPFPGLRVILTDSEPVVIHIAKIEPGRVMPLIRGKTVEPHGLTVILRNPVPVIVHVPQAVLSLRLSAVR